MQNAQTTNVLTDWELGVLGSLWGSVTLCIPPLGAYSWVTMLQLHSPTHFKPECFLTRPKSHCSWVEMIFGLLWLGNQPPSFLSSAIPNLNMGPGRFNSWPDYLNALCVLLFPDPRGIKICSAERYFLSHLLDSQVWNPVQCLVEKERDDFENILETENNLGTPWESGGVAQKATLL